MTPNTTARTRKGRDILRVLTCGSVDDGKSTLLGRLLHDCCQVFDDQAKALKRDSLRFGTTGDDLDFALLLDGLEAEREQGITIDVAYRYFRTAKRSFVLVDAPGHEQYTRNMATGASVSDVAILLLDARKGLLPQTRRHTAILSLLDVRSVVLAINKMDLVDFDRTVFDQLDCEFRDFVQNLSFRAICSIPVAARFGENVVHRSSRTSWYDGPTLIQHLENLDPEPDLKQEAFRFPVQWVNRPNPEFRGYSGTIAGGSVRVGDQICIPRSGASSRIQRIVTMDGERDQAADGDAITLVLADEIDVSRGDLISKIGERPDIAQELDADIVWFDSEPMLPGRQYVFKAGSLTTTGSLSTLKHKLDIETMRHTSSKTLEQNDIGRCSVSLSKPLAFDTYAANKSTGSFIVIDRYTHATIGAGMIRHMLRRATNIHLQKTDVTKAARSILMGQTPCVLWFTGLSGAGKSTIANFVERKLHLAGRYSYLLDGDNIRHGLSRNLGFQPADRVENIRRVGEVAKLMVDAGLVVLVSLISPYRAERAMVRGLLQPGEFIEIFVDAPLAVCQQRDPKGLYAKALAGALPNFTGIGSLYETPEQPEIHLRSSDHTPDALSDQVIAYLKAKGFA